MQPDASAIFEICNLKFTADGREILKDISFEIHELTGNTMITVTHDMRCAEALCDHAVIIADGVISAEGGKELAQRYMKGEW